MDKLKTRLPDNLIDWLDMYAHAIPKDSVRGQLLEMQTEIERLKDELTSLYGDAFYDGFIAAREFEIKEEDQSVADVSDDDVLVWSEHAEAEYLLRLKGVAPNE